MTVSDENTIHALLAPWALGPLLGSVLPTSGAINHTLLPTTAHGRFVLRGYSRALMRSGGFLPMDERWQAICALWKAC